jgi:NADP-dependent 3-hydroxy acid dehydrogenase YdfG
MIAVATGAASGIGTATARRLLDRRATRWLSTRGTAKG